MFPFQCCKRPPQIRWPSMNRPPQASGISSRLKNQYIDIDTQQEICLNLYLCLVSAPVMCFIHSFTTAIHDAAGPKPLAWNHQEVVLLTRCPPGMVDVTKTNVVRNRRMTLERPKPHQGSAPKAPGDCIVGTVICSSVVFFQPCKVSNHQTICP